MINKLFINISYHKEIMNIGLGRAARLKRRWKRKGKRGSPSRCPWPSLEGLPNRLPPSQMTFWGEARTGSKPRLSNRVQMPPPSLHVGPGGFHLFLGNYNPTHTQGRVQDKIDSFSYDPGKNHSDRIFLGEILKHYLIMQSQNES